MTREIIFFRELHQLSLTYGHITKLLFESKFQHKGNKQTENREFQQNLPVFLAGTDSKNKII